MKRKINMGVWNIKGYSSWYDCLVDIQTSPTKIEQENIFNMGKKKRNFVSISFVFCRFPRKQKEDNKVPQQWKDPLTSRAWPLEALLLRWPTSSLEEERAWASQRNKRLNWKRLSPSQARESHRQRCESQSLTSGRQEPRWGTENKLKHHSKSWVKWAPF